jgi:glutamyl-tRNA synthetase
MSTMPRLRLAPSPTGFLHLGNFRTALFTYLLAHHWQGEFILRIEDTDNKREVEGAVESLLSILKTMGLSFSEGPHLGGPFEPYIQSQRLEIYRQHAQQLIDSGKAYYCFATSEELEEMRKQQALAHTPPRYDRRYRDLSLDEAKQKIANGEKYVIRQAMPLDQTITVHDELRGDITFNTNELEDHVLIKSDGWPTYQLASVVDDHLMKITHVTRGDEWLPSLPKNILLYQAFEWEPPLFIHLPLILNKTGGGKLSKRQGDVFVENYLEKGYLPEAIINFCVLLGWHPKDDQEFFSLSELVSIFNLDGIGTSPAIFDEEKLNSINSYYLRKKNIDELLEAALPFFKPLLKDAPDHKKTPKFLKSVLALEQPRLKYLAELTESSALFFASSLEYDVSLLNWKKLNLEQTKANLEELYGYLQNISTENWTQAYLETEVINYLKTGDKALGDYLWPLRVSLSGQKASPGPFEIATVLGKDETLAKIKAANGLIDKNML